ncbi:MAG: hypothetical protein FWB91_00645 [Defluviitaleaceae bacterium]|nr:hypothetical protein [Defluviitaleaceae bacterium]
MRKSGLARKLCALVCCMVVVLSAIPVSGGEGVAGCYDVPSPSSIHDTENETD